MMIEFLAGLFILLYICVGMVVFKDVSKSLPIIDLTIIALFMICIVFGGLAVLLNLIPLRIKNSRYKSVS